MRRYLKRFLILFLGILIFLTSCGGRSRSLDDIKKADKIVVALNAEFPPFEYRNGKNIEGIDVDIIKAYADYIGVKCVINDMDFDATFLSVYSGKADVAISGITVNDKRKRSFTFTESYYNSSQVVIVREDSEYANAESLDELLELLSRNEASIGVQRGTVGEYYSSGDESWGFSGIPNTETISYDNGALAFEKLSSGALQAVILDEAPALMIAKKYNNVKVLDYILTEEEYAIAVQLGNDSLCESLNEFINKIKSDGTLDSILEKYYE